MDYNTFYIYNEIISNNKYLYKKLWSITKNEDRNKFRATPDNSKYKGLGNKDTTFKRF